MRAARSRPDPSRGHPGGQFQRHLRARAGAGLSPLRDALPHRRIDHCRPDAAGSAGDPGRHAGAGGAVDEPEAGPEPAGAADRRTAAGQPVVSLDAAVPRRGALPRVPRGRRAARPGPAGRAADHRGRAGHRRVHRGAGRVPARRRARRRAGRHPALRERHVRRGAHRRPGHDHRRIGSSIEFRNVRHRLYDRVHWMSFEYARAGAVGLLRDSAMFAGLSAAPRTWWPAGSGSRPRTAP